MARYPFVCPDCEISATVVEDGEHHCPDCGMVVSDAKSL